MTPLAVASRDTGHDDFETQWIDEINLEALESIAITSKEGTIKTRRQEGEDGKNSVEVMIPRTNKTTFHQEEQEVQAFPLSQSSTDPICATERLPSSPRQH